MKTPHTPGPWNVWPDRLAKVNGYPAKVIGSEDASVCFLATGSEPVNVANARLIAAAPELLEALKAGQKIVKLLAESVLAGTAAQLTGDEWLAFQREALEAIAKAEGEE